METKDSVRVRWGGWILAVVIYPVVILSILSPLGGLLRGSGGIAVPFSVWACVVALISIGQARAVARQKDVKSFMKVAAIWLGVSLTGYAISLGLFFGACAVYGLR